VLTWKAYEARDGPEVASARLACLPILAIKSAAPAKRRRSIPQELQALIRRTTAENRLWGQRRTQAELARLGFLISAGTVAKYMIRACDFFCVRTILQTAQASLLHAQNMAALGQLTAGMAHEIENPLHFVNNFAGLSAKLLDELREPTAPAIATLDPDKRAEIDETIRLHSSLTENASSRIATTTTVGPMDHFPARNWWYPYGPHTRG